MTEGVLACVDNPRYQALHARLAGHALYGMLRSVTALRVFMEHHVYAVWDFMSLIKSLQAQLAPSSVPWVPPENPRLAHLINQLVLEEESDHALTEPGGHAYVSHFESYCLAMAEVGADVLPVKRFIHQCRREGLENAMQNAGVPEPAKRFMGFTFGMIRNAQPHQLAAVLAYGRESLVPLLFQSILTGLQVGPQTAPILHRYLHRHVELDGDEHATLALNLVEGLCGGNAPKTQRAIESVADALQARVDFWDGICQSISNHRGAPLVRVEFAGTGSG